jgi:hypothetical protein
MLQVGLFLAIAIACIEVFFSPHVTRDLFSSQCGSSLDLSLRVSLFWGIGEENYAKKLFGNVPVLYFQARFD